MKKALRIIFSPLVFLIWMASVIVIPVGILCLLFGIVQCLDRLFSDDEVEIEWGFVFMIVTMPWMSAKQFIETGNMILE